MDPIDRQALEEQLNTLERQLEEAGSKGRSLTYLNSLRHQIAEIEMKLAED